MSVEEAANPIVEFFHKLLGRNLWIVPTAISLSSWYIYNQDTSRWYLLFSAILFGIITVLYGIVCVLSFIKRLFLMFVNEKEEKEQRRKQIEAANNTEKGKKEKYASYIWKFVCHAKPDSIYVASLLLSCEMLNGDKYIRYVPFPESNKRDSEEELRFNAFAEICCYFTYNDSKYCNTLSLIERDQCREGIYYKIDPFFYSLLENYISTNKWEKIPYN